MPDSDNSASGSQSFCYANVRSHPVLTSQTTLGAGNAGSVAGVSSGWMVYTPLMIGPPYVFDIVTYELFGGLGRSDVRLAKSPKWGCALAT
jgi:hypothetical protein